MLTHVNISGFHHQMLIHQHKLAAYIRKCRFSITHWRHASANVNTASCFIEKHQQMLTHVNISGFPQQILIHQHKIATNILKCRFSLTHWWHATANVNTASFFIEKHQQILTHVNIRGFYEQMLIQQRPLATYIRKC